MCLYRDVRCLSGLDWVFWFGWIFGNCNFHTASKPKFFYRGASDLTWRILRGNARALPESQLNPISLRFHLSLSLPLLCCLFSFPKSCRNGKNYMNLTFLNAFKDARIPLLALSSSFMVSKQRWRLDIPPSAFAEILSQTTLQYGDKFAVSKRSTTVRLAL